MREEKLNQKINIPLEEIEEKIKMKINGDLNNYNKVVSPRDLKYVKVMTFMKRDILDRLIRNIPLRQDPSILPYADSNIEVFGREPKGTLVGQTFVLEKKLLSLMRGLENGVFSEFVVKGLSKMPPTQLYGIDENGEKSIAFYIPPIIEIHNNNAVLIDGIHRSTICGSAGTTTNAVHISNVKIELPFTPIYFREVKTVSIKPPIDERYVNLKKEYFRDLGALGIDG